MKQIFFALVVFLTTVTSCHDDSILQNEQMRIETNETCPKSSGMQRMVFQSREELKEVMKTLSSSNDHASKVAKRLKIPLSQNEEDFISLLEYNKDLFMQKLTKAEQAALEKDKEEPEFCLPDSVIADYQFQCLLNKEREIQIGDTVYRYINKGVGFTTFENAAQLQLLDSLTRYLKPSLDGGKHQLDKNICFVFITFAELGDVDYGGGAVNPGNNDDNNNEDYSDSKPAASKDLDISDENLTIPAKDVREIIYSLNGKGDEGSFSAFLKNVFGVYISAQKYFSEDRKLNMNFYDQNYLIYSDIGSKLKMQKKKFGIWWNIKADEMYHGWDMISIKYDYPKPVTSYYPINSAGIHQTPYYINAPVESNEFSQILLHIPFVDYDFTSKDLLKIFKEAYKLAYNRLPDELKGYSQLNNPNQGLFTHNEKSFYVIYGPYQTHREKEKSTQTKFFSKWFPCSFLVTIGITDGKPKIENVNFDFNDHVYLHRGCVWGAIKYKGRWLGARIIKDINNK